MWNTVSSESDGVFIHRGIESEYGKDVFCALVCAAIGCGSRVYTDWVLLDSNGNLNLQTYSHVTLANACIESIRILLSMYEHSGKCLSREKDCLFLN